MRDGGALVLGGGAVARWRGGAVVRGDGVGGGLLGGDDVVGGDRLARAESGGALGPEPCDGPPTASVRRAW